MPRYILAYDAECGACRGFKRVVEFMDSQGRIDFVSLIEADELGFLDKIPRSARHTSFHLIFPGGEVQSGPKAIPSVIESFPLGELFSKGLSAPGGRRLVAYVYSVLSRLHDSGSCRYQTSSAGKGAGRSEHDLMSPTLKDCSYGFVNGLLLQIHKLSTD